MRIAVVGTGIAGNAAAHALANAPHVTELVVYEAEARIGGHSATVDIDYNGKAIAVDTGFIVYNTLNYPHLTALFAHLGVETQDSDMSFSVSMDQGAFEWIGRTHDVFNGLFAQRRNLVNPRYLGMLLEILRFQKAASADRAAGKLTGLTLGDYIAAGRYSAYFRDRYIVPMGAAIWSTPVAQMLEFPAENFVSFFENHKLMHWDRPVWRTVTGGSRNYVEKLTAPFRQRIRLSSPVKAVRRDTFGVSVTTADGTTDRFDHIVIASHS
ncbi:MAG: NAD(P)/FAD-dependent oxidoreductase, partial [Beijerinckiaceae bacterium]